MISDISGRHLHKFPTDYCVFDLETTGCYCSSDSIIEISAVKVIGGQVFGHFSTLVDPCRHIPAQATAVNHITDAMVRGCPPIEEAIARFDEFVGDMVLVGHNISNFDLKFINREAIRCLGGVFSNDYIDTLPLSRRLLRHLPHHTLGDLARYYGIDTDGAHRALNDCIMNQQIFERLTEEAGASVLPSAGHTRNIGQARNGSPLTSPGLVCPLCGGGMVRRRGRFGEFWGCSNFPSCRGTRKV